MGGYRPASLQLANLGEAVNRLPATQEWLTPEERQRLGAMRSARRRHQFLAGHWLLRVVGAEHVGSMPGDWSFATDDLGRPCLRPGDGGGNALHASLSHSGEWVAVAVAECPVGIDIESASRTRDLDRLAAEVFPAKQWLSIAGSSEDERTRGFYEQWTLREAIGKREGRGLVPGIARSQYFERIPNENADAIVWQVDGLSLALAVQHANGSKMSGLPDAAVARGWRLARP